LIQAAVGLLHFVNGNLRGAAKLYRSSRDYMARYGSPYLGLDTMAFWQAMDRCFAGALAAVNGNERVEINPSLIPEIRLDPPPASWPDPESFVEHE
jgi:hypothetical protein